MCTTNEEITERGGQLAMLFGYSDPFRLAWCFNHAILINEDTVLEAEKVY